MQALAQAVPLIPSAVATDIREMKADISFLKKGIASMQTMLDGMNNHLAFRASAGAPAPLLNQPAPPSHTPVVQSHTVGETAGVPAQAQSFSPRALPPQNAPAAVATPAAAASHADDSAPRARAPAAVAAAAAAASHVVDSAPPARAPAAAAAAAAANKHVAGLAGPIPVHHDDSAPRAREPAAAARPDGADSIHATKAPEDRGNLKFKMQDQTGLNEAYAVKTLEHGECVMPTRPWLHMHDNKDHAPSWLQSTGLAVVAPSACILIDARLCI